MFLSAINSLACCCRLRFVDSSLIVEISRVSPSPFLSSYTVLTTLCIHDRRNETSYDSDDVSLLPRLICVIHRRAHSPSRYRDGRAPTSWVRAERKLGRNPRYIHVKMVVMHVANSRGNRISRLEAVGARNRAGWVKSVVRASDRGVCGTAGATDTVGGWKPTSTWEGR